MENKIRNTLNEIYFGKTKDIVNGLRSVQSLSEQRQQADLRNDLAKALQKRQAKGSDNWTGIIISKLNEELIFCNWMAGGTLILNIS